MPPAVSLSENSVSSDSDSESLMSKSSPIPNSPSKSRYLPLVYRLKLYHERFVPTGTTSVFVPPLGVSNCAIDHSPASGSPRISSRVRVSTFCSFLM